MKLKGLIITLILTVKLFAVATAQAKVIQILHTNDLHAALKTAGAPRSGEAEFGGWAQIKTLFDRLTLSAKLQGIETIRLDAGDFYEGTSYYFPEYGKNILKAFQGLGYDAVALGNHDWLMGAQNLNQAFGKTPFSFPVLSANVRIAKNLTNLKQQIIPSTQIIRDGIKIGVFGLSTDEALYQWITRIDSNKRDLQILNYRDDDSDGTYGPQEGIANTTIRKLRKENDLVVALTHIGYDEDQILAQHSRGLDLIVGGHSHTQLESMNQVKDREGHSVSIVQAGYNGKFIGRILVDVIPGKRPQVLTYELVPVPNETQKDPIVAQTVADAEGKVDILYQPARLNEVIGHSEVRLVSGETGPTAYSKFVVDAMKDITGADIGLDVGAFHGNTPQSAGPVTRMKLMEMYPRKFEVEQNEGLYIYEARIPGWLISLGLKYAVKFGMFISFSGLTFDVHTLSDAEYEKVRQAYEGSIKQSTVTPYRISGIRVNGAPICTFCTYSVAAPESLIRGAWGITPLTKLVIRNGHPTPHTIWDAMNHYLYKIGTIKKIKPDEHFTTRGYPDRHSRKHTEHAHEPLDEGEGIDAPWVHAHGSVSTVINAFIKELGRYILVPTLIEKDEKSGKIDGTQ